MNLKYLNQYIFLEYDIPKKKIDITERPFNHGYRLLKKTDITSECYSFPIQNISAIIDNESYKLYLKRYFQCKEDVDRQLDHRVKTLEDEISFSKRGQRIIVGNGKFILA